MKETKAKILRWTLLISVFFGVTFLSACSSADNSYWPMSNNAEWVTSGWTVNHEHFGMSAWPQNGRLRAAGRFAEEHGDWGVIEVSSYFDQQSGVFGMAFLRIDEDKVEVLGFCPESFSGSAAEILMPSSGPLSFDLSPSQIGQTQSTAFDLSFSLSSVHIELEFTLEDLGISHESIAGTFDDVLVFNLAIHSSEAGSVYAENQSIRIWLARGFGPIRAEKTKDDTITGGDFLRN